MNTLPDLLSFIVTTLQAWPMCRGVQVVETALFSPRQFAFKVRAELVTGGTLDTRLYCNGEHTDYAYHLACGEQSVRWDNKEHFPSIPSHPHHFHTASGQVEASPLTGDPAHDLPLVLDYLTNRR
ncbi:MAG: DUF6516 family protein [Thermodesulfobacteriota bacterium]